MSYINTIISIAGGVISWELVKFIFPEIKHYFLSKIKAKDTFYGNIDNLLKSSSQLYGKLLSLAKEDFMTYIDITKSNSEDPINNKVYILYLFSNFWAQIEYIRVKNEYYGLSKIKKGKQLLNFIETFESRKYRILDRSWQRIIGEQLIIKNNGDFRFMTLNEFYYAFNDQSSQLYRSVKKLEEKLDSISNQQEIKQKILIYGIIVVALIYHFDPNHKVIRYRDIFKNKLNRKSKSTVKNNLLKYYLDFVKSKERYY